MGLGAEQETRGPRLTDDQVQDYLDGLRRLYGDDLSAGPPVRCVAYIGDLLVGAYAGEDTTHPGDHEIARMLSGGN